MNRRLDDALDEDLDLYSFSISQGEAPRATFVKAASPERLADLAEQLHIRMVYDPARHLADLVDHCSATALPLSAGPPNDDPVERFDEVTFGWTTGAKPFSPGLHSFALHGMKVFRVLDDSGDWHVVDRADGQLAVLRGRGDVMCWHKQSQDAQHPRALSAPGRISLPALVERAATSASGLLPLFKNGRRIYLNVDRDVATTLASSLGLVLTRTHEIDIEKD